MVFAEEDAEQVRRNTRLQNNNLDIVEDAAGDIKRLAYVTTPPPAPHFHPAPACLPTPSFIQANFQALGLLSRLGGVP